MSSEAEVLRPFFSELVRRLKPDDIVDKLFETELLTQAEYEAIIKDISQQSDLRGVNRRILMAVINGRQGSVRIFVEILRASQSDLAREIQKGKRTPVRSHSTSEIPSMTAIKEDVAMQHRPDDVAQSLPTPSPSTELFPGTFDTADPVVLPTESQPNSPNKGVEKGFELERPQKKAASHTEEELSRYKEKVAELERKLQVAISHMEEQSSRIEEQSSRIEEQSSCLKRLHLQVDELSARNELNVFQTAPLLHDGCELKSEKLSDLPIDTGCATAVIIERKMYVCGGRCGNLESCRVVHVHNLNEGTWTTLPKPAPQYRCEAIALKGQLVLLGGFVTYQTITNMVSTWTGQRWRRDIPAMPTKRVRPGVIMRDKYVVAAGGMSDPNRTLLNSINILDTSTLQWWTPANFQLPLPMYALDMTVCSSYVYVAAAIIDYNTANKAKTGVNKAWQLPVSVLEEVFMRDDGSPRHYHWKEIAPTPNLHSTVLKDCAHLLAIGGALDGDQSGCNSSSNISVYNPICNRWSTVGQLHVPRARCTAVAVTRSKFLVLGGYSDTTTNPQPRIRSTELLNMY